MANPLTIDERFLINIFKKYLQAKLLLHKESATNFDQLQEKQFQYGADNQFEQLINYHHHMQIVETILALMPKKEYFCLVKDFLTNDSEDWWKKYYSYNYYQKLRQTAIKRFLYLFLI
ncbi:MAG: hypothetical protein REH79_03010 [Spiroplasma sp.]|nr:hypothetical protein [Spiroplasma sp.]